MSDTYSSRYSKNTQEFLSRKDQYISKRFSSQNHVVGPDCHCKRVCFEKVKEEERKDLINQLNSIASIDGQIKFLRAFIKPVPIQRRRPRIEPVDAANNNPHRMLSYVFEIKFAKNTQLWVEGQSRT